MSDDVLLLQEIFRVEKDFLVYTHALEARVLKLELAAEKPVKKRDRQRSRVYACDAALAPWSKPLPKVADVKAYVAKVFKAIGSDGPLPTIDGKKRNYAAASATRMKIPPFARNECTVLHELAHVITNRKHGAHVAGHGPDFCSIYLKLVSTMMGRKAHDALKNEMTANRVSFEPTHHAPPQARLDPLQSTDRLDHVRPR
jgi:hypothetical protein